MGTTRVKLIDLSSDEKQIKTSRKHAEKSTSAAKIKEKKEKPEEEKRPEETTKEKPVEEKKVETKVEKKPKTQKKEPVKKQVHHLGKKYKDAKQQIENKAYKVKDALDILPKTSITKFDPAVEIHLNVVDKNIKGNVSYPHSIGSKQKKQKYLIFSDNKKEIAGANIIWANDTTISLIENGKLKAGRDFDQVIAAPIYMPKLAKIAKILGPKGMMPNPKNGTITEDYKKATSTSSDSNYSYKSDPMAPIIHAKIGKLSQKSDALTENLKALISTIGASKIKKAALTTSMGPSVKLDITSL